MRYAPIWFFKEAGGEFCDSMKLEGDPAMEMGAREGESGSEKSMLVLFLREAHW